MDEQAGEQGEGQAGPPHDGAAEARAVEPSAWDSMAKWTQAERDYWFMGPFDGRIPGMVRRVRRILDVSQRGLAALLDVSQSAVARWETGRTSPRMSVVERLMRMARIRLRFLDEETGELVRPMRADGARTHGGNRYPAHTDLRAVGWWVPRRLRSMTSIEAFEWEDRSKRVGDPAITYRLSPFWRTFERMRRGVPNDHPAVHQFVAEVPYVDECREERRRRMIGGIA